jgi:hypothetical protein
MMNGALSRSCGRVEKDYELSTTTTASMTPVPVWTSSETYNPQWEESATGVTKPKDRVLRDKSNVAHHGTPPKKNMGAGKPKDTLATGTSDSPRARQDDLARIARPCSPRRQISSPSRERSAGISKAAYDPLGAQTKRAAELRAAYTDQRRTQQFKSDPLLTLQGCEEDADSI